MTDQPQPGAPGNSGAWQPVPGGGDYDPDQTMHVSFAAQLPPEPRPGEDPLGAHGPVGPPGAAGPGEPDAATTWSIPVIRDDADGDSGEFSVGSFAAPWDQAPPPAPTQSFPAGMFGQGAAAAAHAQQRAQQQAHQQPHAQPEHAQPEHRQPPGDGLGGAPDHHLGAAPQQHLSGQWAMPFPGPDVTEGIPWPPAEPAWSGVVDDPEGPPPGAQDAHTDPAAGHQAAPDTAFAHGPHDSDRYGRDGGYDAAARTRAQGELIDPVDAAHPLDAALDRLDGAEALAALQDLSDDDPAAAGQDGPEGHSGAEEAREAGEVRDLREPPAEDEARTGPEAADAAAEPPAEPVEETHSEHPLASYTLRVNGADRPVTDAWLGESLLYVLRERLGLAGAKDGCEQGECGACSVQVDGRLVASCLVPAATAAGSEVRTVEGLSVDGRPSDVQRALAESGAVQCGFCVPGMAMTVHDLLEGNHKPTDLETRQALCGNLCRCSGYRGVLDAVGQVVAAREAEAEADSASGAAANPTRVPHQGGPVTNPPAGGAV